MAGTLVGQRWSASGSSSSLSLCLLPEALMSKSLGTTEKSFRAGGRAEAVIIPKVKSSSTSMPLLKQDIHFHTRYIPSKENPADGPLKVSTITAPSSLQLSFPAQKTHMPLWHASHTSIGDLAPTTLSSLTIQTGHGWWCLLMGQWIRWPN